MNATAPPTQPASAPAKQLLVCDLQCVRNDEILFDHVNFELNPGGVVQIEGKNGSGKTSLLRILCGLSNPSSGKVIWCGRDIQQYRPEYLIDVAYVGHANGVKDELSCIENLNISRALANPNRIHSCTSALQRMGLEELEEAPARTLSAGQRRRLALARLLVNQARLWILDEPFTAIDKSGRALLETLFDEHCAAGGMVIVTTHHNINVGHSGVQHIWIAE